MKLLQLLAAAAIASLPLGANATTFLGQLEIVGNVNANTSEFSSTGQIDFTNDPGFATLATGVFSDIVTLAEDKASATEFSLFDVFFDALPDTLYSGGGFSFELTSAGDFDNAFPSRGFMGGGIISGAFGSLPGIFSLSTQESSPGLATVSFSSSTIAIPLPAPVLMLLAALGGLGFLGWRRKTVIAA